MNQFLAKVRLEFINWNYDKWNKILHVVIGNEACDLDSAVSSITQAWYKTQICDSTLFVPVLNIPKNQFRLKTEIVFLFKKLNIEQSNILFRDEIDFQKLSTFGKNHFHVTLVDHHILPRSLSFLEPHIKAIIDHRPKQGSFREEVNVKLELVGSCSTLVAENIYTHLLTEDILSDIKLMLLGAILIDTGNLKNEAKVTEKDQTFVKKLKSVEIDLNKFYIDLTTAKLSVEGLTTRDMILKDPKFLENSTSKIMFSSLHQTQKSLIQRPDFLNVIKNECESENLNIWFSLAMIEKNKKSETYKPILIFCKDNTKREKVIKTLVETAPLKIKTLKEEHISDSISLLGMYNCSATRKQLMPVLNQLLTNNEI